METVTVHDALGATPYEDRTLSALLRARAETDPDHHVCVVDGEERTWSDLAGHAGQLAGALASLGVGKGTVVAHLAGNTANHVDVVFAVALLGAIECPINTGLRGESLRHVLTDSGAEVLIVEPALLEHVMPVRPPGLREVVMAGDELPAAPRSLPPTSSLPSDPAMLLYTSGTTGPAKGVVLPQHFAFSAAAVKTAAWGLSSADVLYSPLPLFHSNARFSTLLTACVLNAKAVLGARFSASRFWRDVTGCGATEVGVVGTIPAILLARPPDPAERAHRVRQIHGAGALSHAQRREFEERFKTRLVVGFAMTETSHIATTGHLDPGRYRGAGRPVDGFDLAILDRRDTPLPPGEVGEIAVRPQLPYSMFSGYHGRPDATVAAFRNLWFHTGDLGQLDEDGYLHWVDRIKDAIRHKGEMISSRDVEAAAVSFAGVAEAAAVGVPAPLGDEDVLLCVQQAPGATVDVDGLREHCAGQLPAFAVPAHVIVVDELPRTSTHKVVKADLRRDWLRQATEPTGRVAGQEGTS